MGSVVDSDQVRIVIVEDDRDVADVISGLLELDGYEVLVAGTAVEALAVIAQYRPCAVLLDLGLPDIDGLELAKQLRAEYGTELILVAVTGRAGDKNRMEADSAGIDFVIVKPVDVKILKQIFPPLN